MINLQDLTNPIKLAIEALLWITETVNQLSKEAEGLKLNREMANGLAK